MIEVVESEGIPGILIAPLLVGLETTRALLAESSLMVIAHPSFTGTFFQDPDHGIAHGLLLGTLFRLLGADASVFPNFGGRFTFTREQCLEIGNRLREPLGSLAPAFPAPAGGMKLESLAGMSRDHGRDAIFLIGAALLGHSDSLSRSTRVFLREMEGSEPPTSAPPGT